MRKPHHRRMKIGAGIVLALAAGVGAASCGLVLGVDDLRVADCKDGAKQCAETTPQLCQEGRWESLSPCEKACNGGVCGECAVGSKRCAGNGPQSCGEDGEWAPLPVCDAPTHCQGGECVVSCAPGVDVWCFGNTPYVCDVGGDWKAGESCDAQTCINGECAGECALGDARCSGKTPQSCDETGHWKDWSACAGACVDASCPGPSCKGLPETCGPDGTESCCVSPVVLGGSFNRSNAPAAPATVSDFRLDRFEVTVGRFRNFVKAYPGSMPAPGAGAHPKIANSGWNAAWNTHLPVTQATLTNTLKCATGIETWTDTAQVHENLPLNCITWYLAFAFCAWDGGRLPTEAEWNYAAAGGNEQRAYPWSAPPGAEVIDEAHAVYDCRGAGDPTDCVVEDILKVGSRSPKGDGKWGQADLGGSMWEWLLDGYADSYEGPCEDCAALLTGELRVVRGGSWSSGAADLHAAHRNNGTAANHYNISGFRCARQP